MSWILNQIAFNVNHFFICLIEKSCSRQMHIKMSTRAVYDGLLEIAYPPSNLQSRRLWLSKLMRSSWAPFLHFSLPCWSVLRNKAIADLGSFALTASHSLHFWPRPPPDHEERWLFGQFQIYTNCRPPKSQEAQGQKSGREFRHLPQTLAMAWIHWAFWTQSRAKSQTCRLQPCVWGFNFWSPWQSK